MLCHSTEPDVKERAYRLRRGRRGRGAHRSIGVERDPRSTMSNRYPSARSGTVVSQSNVEMSRPRARSSGMLRKIGSCERSGSPGKYICVTRRDTIPAPKSEKWMCDGRHALR